MYGINRLRKKRIGKKGSFESFLFIGTLLLFFAVVTLICFKVYGEFNTEIQSKSDIPTEAKTASATILGHYNGVIDNTFLLLTMGLAIGTFILAALVRIHPIFIPLYIIVLTFIIFLCGVFSNVYQEMAATPEFAGEAASLTFITHILTYLPLIVGIFGTLLMIVMYKTWRANLGI